jgi:hypothetical protein
VGFGLDLELNVPITSEARAYVESTLCADHPHYRNLDRSAEGAVEETTTKP